MVNQTNTIDIQTVGLTKSFRDFWGHTRVLAVDNLDLEIHRGEIFGLLGPNGSGKSTTIKMLLGLLFPTRGVAKVLDRPPGDVKTNHYIGYLPEESYLYPYLNARETLDFYGRIFGLASGVRKKRISSLLDMVGLSANVRRPIGEFSKGMQRRIGLAQALINDPDLLILDEPTSGMDPLGTRQIKDLICELGKRGKTVLLCSHLLADVEDVCDRIGILYGGKLRNMGAMDDLLASHNATQIRTRKLTFDTIEKVRAVVNDESMQVQTPREKLEDYFLRIVEQAQQDQLATSGAIMSTGISDFLGDRDRPTTTLIDELVTGKEVDKTGSAEASGTTSVPVETTPVRQDVLDNLASDVPGEDLTVPVQPAEPESTPDTPVDRSVIDNLLKEDHEKTNPNRREEGDNEPRP
jgi:ABC-2 type transport system ATP-binding protein